MSDYISSVAMSSLQQYKEDSKSLAAVTYQPLELVKADEELSEDESDDEGSEKTYEPLLTAQQTTAYLCKELPIGSTTEEMLETTREQCFLRDQDQPGTSRQLQEYNLLAKEYHNKTPEHAARQQQEEYTLRIKELPACEHSQHVPDAPLFQPGLDKCSDTQVLVRCISCEPSTNCNFDYTQQQQPPDNVHAGEEVTVTDRNSPEELTLQILNSPDTHLQFQNLDGYFIPLHIWKEAFKQNETLKIGQVLFNALFSSEEIAGSSKSGKNNTTKLRTDKLLAIPRAISWITHCIGENILKEYDPRKPLPSTSKMPDKELVEFEKKLFSAYRNQKRIKDSGQRRKSKLTNPAVPTIYFIPVEHDVANSIVWTKDSQLPPISRVVWAHAFLETMKGCISVAARELFDGLFTLEEQLQCSIKGTAAKKRSKTDSGILDPLRLNGIILIVRWMKSNLCNYPYDFVPLTKDELMENLKYSSEEETEIRSKVFVQRPNQRKQVQKKRSS